MLNSLLDQIKSIGDFKKIKKHQINILAEELRNFLIANVSKTGGHLASNLGVVELTLALHTIFDSPKDKIIWDVGHQSYIHKILTGRKDDFHTLRQYKGLSGFPKRLESDHDHFDTGHSSTSISAALGMACARDLNKEKHSVVAVIGDGALTGGMAFEALNHAGQSNKNITIILNDNEMSISENVGGVSNYLNKIRTTPLYYKFKGDMENLIVNIPAIGKSVYKTAEKAKDCIKYFFVPGVLFEELGFTYLGPIDGHNYAELCKVLESSKNISGPILLHVVTKKGKGYAVAENAPEKFHGIGPFNIDTGELLSTNKNLTYSELVGNLLVEHAENNEKIVAITAAMPSGTGLVPFSKTFPNRFFDVGIAEQHAVTFAAGIAAAGYKPFFAVYSTFLSRAMGQVINDVCLQSLPVTFLIDRAGIVGNDGETHHGIMDISMLYPIPNLTILAPKDGNELREMMDFVVNFNGPVAIRYPRGNVHSLSSEFPKVSIESKKGEILYNTGKDALIIAVGHMNELALQVCERLKHENINVTLINPRFLKPLDSNLILENAIKCKKVYTIEDNYKYGGFGSQICSLLNEHNIFKEVNVFAFPDRFIEHGDVNLLYDVYGLTVDDIVTTISKDFDSNIINKIVFNR